MNKLKALLRNQHNAALESFDIVKVTNDLEAQAKSSTSPIFMSESAGIGMEDFGRGDADQFQAAQSVYEALENFMNEHNFSTLNSGRADSTRISENQMAAGTASMLLGGKDADWKKALRKMATVKGVDSRDTIHVQPAMSGPFGAVPVVEGAALENYNEKSQRDFRVVTAVYNHAAARQDPFGEALYPTVVVTPDEGGYVQHLSFVSVNQDAFHQASGALFDANEVNLVEALRDPGVLEDESTALIPVIDDGMTAGARAATFVPEADVAETTVDLPAGLGTLNTAPLRAGAQIDLIGYSNRNQLIQGNVLDASDTIDPSMRLKAIYVKVGGSADRVFKFMVERMPTAVFVPALVGESRKANLNFSVEDLLIRPTTSTVDGLKNTQLDDIAAAGVTLRLRSSVAGLVDTQRGTTQINPIGNVEIVEARDADGLVVAHTGGGAIGTAVTAIGAMEVIGYDLDARFTNTNRRQRGQLLLQRMLQFRYPVPMHAPLTLPMSTMDEAGPGEVVKALTAATNIRNSNNAVKRLLNYLAQLKDVSNAGYTKPKFGAVEGALTAMIRPTYVEFTLDLRNVVDTVRSGDRFNDVSAAIMDVIRALLYPAVQTSNINAAFQTVTGDLDARPKFVVATDIVLANYLQVKGDDRTLGPQYEYDVVSTNNERMDNKIIIVPTGNRVGEDSVLNWGNFVYVPSIVADLPISRNGQISREIAAVPFNLHVNNIPFAIEINVLGLEDVMSTGRFNSLPGFQVEQVEITTTP